MESNSYTTVATCDTCRTPQVEGTMLEVNGTDVMFTCTKCELGGKPSTSPEENSPPPDRSDVLDYL